MLAFDREIVGGCIGLVRDGKACCFVLAVDCPAAVDVGNVYVDVEDADDDGGAACIGRLKGVELFVVSVLRASVDWP